MKPSEMNMNITGKLKVRTKVLMQLMITLTQLGFKDKADRIADKMTEDMKNNIDKYIRITCKQ